MELFLIVFANQRIQDDI